MEFKFSLFLAPSVLGFFALNAYLGWRVCVLWVRGRAARWALGLTLLFWVLASAHISRALARDIGWPLIARTAELWLGLAAFLGCYFLCAEIAWLCARRTRWKTPRVRGRLFAVAALAACLTALWGYYHAQELHVAHYALTVEKDGGALRHVRVAVLADMHLGKGRPPLKLQQAIALTNAQQPDVVVLTGDIAEFSAENFECCEYDAVFRQLRAPMGVYAVRGNHDFFDTDHTRLRRMLRRANILLVEDTVVSVASSFYIAGRKDRGQPRAPLGDILKLTDPKKPLLLIDHRPELIEQSQAAGVDVQFSGHTHGGQFFPVTLFSRLIYPIHSGVLKKGPFALVVSSGLWGGAPYRVGTQSEIVVVDIDFVPKGS